MAYELYLKEYNTMPAGEARQCAKARQLEESRGGNLAEVVGLR
jgi:hypothetical protein